MKEKNNNILGWCYLCANAIDKNELYKKVQTPYGNTVCFCERCAGSLCF